MTKEEKFKETIRCFTELNIKEWSHFKQSVGGGGQATGLVVYNDKGIEGVFRLAHCETEKAKLRFKRELNILTEEKFSHPNIVEILDYTKNPDEEFWYISRKGITLHEYWNKYIQKEKDIDKIVIRAIQITLELLDGLEVCHNHIPVVIHRDIKSKNVIVINEVPQLIDFGIAYQDDGENITSANEAPANRRAVDMQLYRGEEKTPWYDVYLMAQLLIWMVCEDPLTTWERPLNWKFVKFPEGVSDAIEVKLKCIFALCSNRDISPQNANDLKNLINSLFMVKSEPRSSGFDISEIKDAIAEGNSIIQLSQASDFELFDALLPNFLENLERIRELFEYLTLELSEFGGQIEYNGDTKEWVDNCRKEITEGRNQVTKEIFSLRFMASGKLYIRLLFFPTEFLKLNAQLNIKEPNCRMLVNFDVIGNWKSQSNFRETYPQVIAFAKDGSYTELDTSFNIIGELDYESLKQRFINFFNDRELWKVII